MEYPYVKKNLLGKYQIHYLCWRCEAGLISPLDKAGSNDQCPDCGQVFTVPGTELRDQVRQQQEQDKIEKQLAKEEKRVAAEQAKEKVRQQRQQELERQRQAQSIAHAAVVPPVERTEKQCPYCGETILAVARKCKHCGEFLDGTRPPSSAVTVKQTKDSGCGLIVTIALGIVLAVLLLAFL